MAKSMRTEAARPSSSRPAADVAPVAPSPADSSPVDSSPETTERTAAWQAEVACEADVVAELQMIDADITAIGEEQQNLAAQLARKEHALRQRRDEVRARLSHIENLKGRLGL